MNKDVNRLTPQNHNSQGIVLFVQGLTTHILQKAVSIVPGFCKVRMMENKIKVHCCDEGDMQAEKKKGACFESALKLSIVSFTPVLLRRATLENPSISGMVLFLCLSSKSTEVLETIDVSNQPWLVIQLWLCFEDAWETLDLLRHW